MFEFKTIESSLETERRLNQKVKPSLYQGMEFKPEQYQKVDFADSMLINVETFMNQVYNSNSMTLDQVRELVLPNVPLILDNLVNNRFGYDYSNIFKNAKVLAAMREYFSQISDVDINLVMMVDKLVYHSLTLMGSINPDDKLITHYRGLANEVNKNIIKRILAINSRDHGKQAISPLTANYIAIARYSEFDPSEIRLVERVNNITRFGLNSNEVFTKDVMIDIYCLLFDKLSGLVNGTFLKSLEFIDIPETEIIIKTKRQQISAVVEILNSQPHDLIRQVLTEYSKRFYTIYQGNQMYLEIFIQGLRQSDTNNRFHNIYSVLEDMQAVGVIVP